jgi:hypothetical protein
VVSRLSSALVKLRRCPRRPFSSPRPRCPCPPKGRSSLRRPRPSPQVLDAVSRMSIEQKVGQMTQIDVSAVVSYVGECRTGFLWEDSLSCQVPRGCLWIQEGAAS